MRFCDETQIEVRSGNGGNGALAFRREKFIPRGGPNGGDGGKGGDLILASNPHLNSLIDLHMQRHFEAGNGKNGSSYLKHGENGTDKTVEVPVGTLVTDAHTGEILIDMNKENMKITLLPGGRGGYGNAHFTSSTRQTPRFAELGEPGRELYLKLELKLVADVGIIGVPSAGKSTLISRISSARPKIADYPFTTLVPNLGVAKMGTGRSLVICDIPGLIEGAHEGKGLGHEFLRHITRSRVFIHLVDITREDIAHDYKVIRKELSQYSAELAKKTEIIVFSKIDILGDDEELLTMMMQDFSEKTKVPLSKIMAISSASGKNLSTLLEKMWEMVLKEKKKKTKKNAPVEQETPVLQPHLKDEYQNDRTWEVSEQGKNFVIHGKRIEQIAVMTDYSNPEAVLRLRDVMKKLGIERELKKRGAEEGSKIFFGSQEEELHFVASLSKRVRKSSHS